MGYVFLVCIPSNMYNATYVTVTHLASADLSASASSPPTGGKPSKLTG